MSLQSRLAELISAIGADIKELQARNELNWREAWLAANTYAVNDAVSYNGGSYVSLANGTTGSSNPPTNTAKWAVLSAKGDAGAKGQSIYVVIANLTNIASVSGSVIGDSFINGDSVSHTILGLATAPGGVVKSTSATAGTADGSLKGQQGDPADSAMDVQTFTASGTWTKPSGCTVARVIAIGGGGGGGSGRRGAATTARSGGAGGAGGGYAERQYLVSELLSTETVSVGTGGSGGAAVTADNTNGNAGQPGFGSQFGGIDHLAVGGGGGGGAGVLSATATSGAAGIGMFPGTSGGSSSALSGSSAAATQGGAGGGGGGGVLTAADAVGSSGVGATQQSLARQGGQPGEDGEGSASGTGPGAGGGGGLAHTAAAGGAGGLGGSFGGGGGGGAASANTFASGAGGKGAAGFVMVVCW